MKFKIVLLVLLCSFFVSAGDVVLISLHYENEEISLSEQSNLIGNYPDRKLQGGEYTLNLVSAKDEPIYSFNFDVPSKVYIDSSQSGGDVIELDAFDFGLLVPYFKEAKEVTISKKGEEVLNFKNPKSKRNYSWIWLIIIIIVILIVLGFCLFNRNTYKIKKEI